jgi:outer membrane protein TolC
LPTVTKSPLLLDTSALPADASPNPVEASYRGLTEADCPRLAARASTLGNLLDYKAEEILAGGNEHLLLRETGAELSSVALRQAAGEARLRSAGDAMEAFYRLIEAEGRRDLLLLGLKEADESLLRARELQSQGLTTPVEISVIRKQLTDLRSDELKLRITILQLNARLKVLLGLSPGDYALWPMADLKVVPEETDTHQAVDYGMQHRPDLAFLWTLVCSLDSDSLAFASQALGAVSPLLGRNASCHCCASLLERNDCSPTEWARQQLQSLLAERQRQATEEIRQAVGVTAYRAQLVILARDNVEIEDRRVQELEEQQDKGFDAEAELSVARLNLYKAQGEQLDAVVNWKIARAQLQQAQGQLLEELPWTDNAAPPVPPMESAP